MNEKLRGEVFRTTLVCVDSYDDHIPTGRFFDPCLAPGQSFHSLMQLLQQMEQALNLSPTAPLVGARECRSGQLATFAVRILFCRNGSWQGCVTWLEGRQEQHFRSVLDLVCQMHNMLQQKQSA